jgi:soluble lytic murein transglycosylase
MTSQRRPFRLIGLLSVAALVAFAGGVSAGERKPAKTEKHAVKPTKKADKRAAKSPKHNAAKTPAKQAKPAAPHPAHPTSEASIDTLLSSKGGHLLSTTPILPTSRFNATSAVPVAVPPTPAGVAPGAPLAAATTSSTSASDIALVKRAIDLVKQQETSQAVAVQKTIEDPLARKLVEWAILRSDDHEANFDRFAAFVNANPSWPSAGLLRKRAENTLWDEKRDAATVRAFFADAKPTTPKGRFALARALLSEGDRASAAHYAREAWRNDTFSRDLEKQAEDAFGNLLTHADYKARMEKLFYAEETDDAMRIARRLGGAQLAIAKARNAVIDRVSKAGALLDAVPESARRDAGYIFARAQWLRRQEKWIEAGRTIINAPRDPALLVSTDDWWNERRYIARGLLDADEPAAAYRVAAEAVTPAKPSNRVEHEFTAGWIALRFLKNPNAAYQHFARITKGTVHPLALSRAEYWMGRAAEAAGNTGEARAHYRAAAHHPTAYYGQIARAKLGLGDFAVRRPSEPSNRSALMRLEVVRAVQLLYAIDARDLVIPFVHDLAEKAVDVGALTVVGEIAEKYDDARAMLYLGKAALARGFAFDIYAFPTNGMPNFRIVGPDVDRSVVYSIARTESAFNPKAISPAKALGLMQVLPGTAKLVAKKFGFGFDAKKLLSDPSYNAQIGAAELGDRLEQYRGSYILTFCAYNAGPGRVKQWIARYGDPRDADADPIDWVERIPISETRNYVQRVLESMQVYRAQFGNGTRLMIEADLRRGGTAN